MPTDVHNFIDELGAGVFEKKVAIALGEVSAAVIDNDKKGSVTLKFDIARIGSSHQVTIKHQIAQVMPTKYGKKAEENTTETPMHIGRNGYLSVFPEDQTSLLDIHGGITEEGAAK